MTDDQLVLMQRQLAVKFGIKVDVYHSEMHRGILVVPHGLPLHPENIISAINY